MLARFLEVCKVGVQLLLVGPTPEVGNLLDSLPHLQKVVVVGEVHFDLLSVL